MPGKRERKEGRGMEGRGEVEREREREGGSGRQRLESENLWWCCIVAEVEQEMRTEVAASGNEKSK